MPRAFAHDMLSAVRTPGSRFILLLACALLGACAVSPRPSGGFSGGALRWDTERMGRMKQAAVLGEAGGAATSSAMRVAASRIALLAPTVVAALFPHDESELERLEKFLLECVQSAEREVNAERWGARAPTAADCKAVVGVDRCGRPITQAMELGTRKHAHALACMRDILKELWPAPFSIEQRYRFYRHAKVIETVSPEQEQRLLAEDCTEELRGTIKPDVVLHADRNLLRAVSVLDLKFPCPGDREPKWTRYVDRSAYAGFDQNRIYEEALGGTALMLSPRGIFE